MHKGSLFGALMGTVALLVPWSAERPRPMIQIAAPAVEPAIEARQIESDALPQWVHRAIGDDGAMLWPEDPDEVPAWVIERNAWRATFGGKPLPYSTRREAEAHLASFEREPLFVEASEPAPPLSHYAAAERFLAWLRKDSVVGEFTAEELKDLYGRFCIAANVTPTAVDHVKKKLFGMPGVYREVLDKKVNGRRQRPVVWIIEPAASNDVDEIEHDDEAEPIRLAA